jgi:hypothetical protein
MQNLCGVGDFTPIGLADAVTNFGQVYGNVVAAKDTATRYPNLATTWQDLMTRGANLQQIIARVNNMSAAWGSLETFVSGVLNSLIPAGMLPDAVNQVNLYAISQWEDDAAAFLNQISMTQGLESSGMTASQINQTLAPGASIGNTITGAVSSMTTGITNIGAYLLIAALIYGMTQSSKH